MWASNLRSPEQQLADVATRHYNYIFSDVFFFSIENLKISYLTSNKCVFVVRAQIFRNPFKDLFSNIHTD